MNTELVGEASGPETAALRPVEMKAPGAFRTISEVAASLDLPQHVLRFWESKFQQIRPMKRGGGRRYYRPEDVALITGIKDLLYNQGFTIRGVQKLLKEKGRVLPGHVAPVGCVPVDEEGDETAPLLPLGPPVSVAAVRSGFSPQKRCEIESVLAELRALRDLLRQSGV